MREEEIFQSFEVRPVPFIPGTRQTIKHQNEAPEALGTALSILILQITHLIHLSIGPESVASPSVSAFSHRMFSTTLVFVLVSSTSGPKISTRSVRQPREGKRTIAVGKSDK